MEWGSFSWFVGVEGVVRFSFCLCVGLEKTMGGADWGTGGVAGGGLRASPKEENGVTEDLF